MSDTVLTVLIVALAVVVVLYLFRGQLRRFLFKANREGIEAELTTRAEAGRQGRQDGINISRSKQIGKGNVIEIGRRDVNVEDALQLGEDQKIVAKPDASPDKKK